MNYKQTINLPQTDFPMKANLAALEPAMQRKWDEMDLYGLVRRARRGAPKYVLHDGPPYPTGDLHIGTGLNKVLKDFLVRYRTMRGYDAPYVPGWDCHGLPIEVQVLQEVGEDRKAMSRSEVRARCRRHSLRYVGVQKAQFKSLGVLGDWEDPYLTLLPAYEAGVLEVLAEMAGKGFIYRDLKPIHWCYGCGTVLAEAELEYEDVVGPSVYVNFPLLGDVSGTFGTAPDESVHVLIWTTTPWTLPANLAVAVRPDAEYTAVRYRHPGTGRTLVSVMACGAVERVMAAIGVGEYECLGRAVGRDLEGLRYRHPFMERESPFVLADYVTLTEGTGCVHTAPGHGQEDYATGLRYSLGVLSPVDEGGYFTQEAGPFAGQHITDGDGAIVRRLVEAGFMLDHGESAHSYPHCWRCHQPVIFRATQQWFVRIDHHGFRQKALEAVQGVEWAPAWGEQRIFQMIAERPDWVISRQKSWGVPVPAFYCRRCGRVLLTRQSVLHVAQAFAERGSDAWFADESAEPFLLPGTRCECGASDWRKETDILDVWFESGSSHNSVCRKRPELAFPADLYLEGVDQYRGWFQLSLLPSLAAWEQAPYKAVLTHGFVVDEEGRKMSKSLGNFISLAEGVETFRAEILRLWCSSVDYRDPMPVNRDYLRTNMADAYRRVRNTFRFLLGNTSDFDPARDAVPYADLPEMDRWALDELARLVQRVTRAWEQYELHQVYGLIHNFCAVAMSATYLDALKDRLYCSGADWPERRSAQTVLRHVLIALCKMTAPILVHTAEEVWSHVAHPDEDVPSVHLCRWPEPPAEWLDDDLHERWRRLLAVREDVARAVEALREKKEVAQNMQVSLRLAAVDAPLRDLLASRSRELLELLMVSELEVADAGACPPAVRRAGPEAAAMTAGAREPGLLILAVPSRHPKCARCWNLRESVGSSAKQGFAAKHEGRDSTLLRTAQPRLPAGGQVQQSSEHPDLCARCARAVAGG